MSADSKKHKSKWFRIATAGDTTDGREIQPSWISEMAESYDPNVYGARINVEHLRSCYPDSTFGAYGDVLALKTETVDVQGQERLALFGLIQPNDQLIALNNKNQKIYTSVEIAFNFAKTGKAYLVGLAVTDSPASLGTEMLQFAAKAEQNPFAGRKQHPDNVIGVATLQADFNFEPSTFENILDKVKGLFVKVDNHTADTEANFADTHQATLAVAQETANLADTQKDMQERFTKLQSDHSQLQQELTELSQKLSITPAYDSRPEVTGSLTEIDC